ncbi:MAG: energy transducer TonB [Desulfobacterales bacterium]
MKRLIPAAIVAVGIHCLLMMTDFDWMKLTDVEKTSAGSVTIILESVQPQAIRPKNDPIASNQPFQKEKRDVVETAPKAEPPLTPAVQPKPVQATRKPEKTLPIAKTVPAQPDQAPQSALESMPEESPQFADTPLTPPKEEASAFGHGPVAAVSSQPALPSVLEEALPDYNQNPPISYPDRARQKGYEGTVVLEVLVNRSGKVDDLRVLASSGYAILDRSAVNSVKTWSFTPARRGKDTVDMWVRVPVRFKLE